MSVTTRRVCITRPAVRDTVSELRNAVVELAADGDARPEERENIALVVSEAITNSVVHAYADRDVPGTVTVEAWLDGRDLVVCVQDEGPGVRPRADSPGLGLGLPFMAHYAREFEIEEPAGTEGARLRLVLPLAPA